jgi:hypothetical protein
MARNLRLWLVLIAALVFVSSPAFARMRYSAAGTPGSAKAFDAEASAAAANAAAAAAAATAAKASSGSQAGIKPGEKDLLEDMLRESDVLNLLEQEQIKHEKRLKELQNRLERELQQVQQHFESVMSKLKKTEEQLELNLKNVEKSLIQQVKASNERTDTASSGWRLPFIILLLLLLGLGGFFGKLYRNATKGMRML